MPGSIPRFAACCDIGGSKVLIGLVDDSGRILARDRYPIGAEQAPHDVVSVIAKRTQALIIRSGLTPHMCVGIGCTYPGMGDPRRGVVFFAPNLAGWTNVPLQHLLESAMGLPAIIDMDANAAAVGEAWAGAGAGAESLIYVVVGTGIGAGIVLNGKIYRGWSGAAGELGHTTIEPNGPPCTCGNYGCLEAMAAGPAIALRARNSIRHGRATLIERLAGDQEITAEIVAEAARRGDALAGDIMRQTGEFLGIGISNVMTLLNPQTIVLGGGVMTGAGDLLLPQIRQSVRQRCGRWLDLQQTRVEIATCGEDSALLGLARLVHGERTV